MAWIDSHCHLDDAQFDHDIDNVITSAQQQGIQQFIIPSVGHQRWQRQVQLQQSHPYIFNAFGIHPWFCDIHQEEYLEQLERLLVDAVAVGECGLDLMPNQPELETQLWWFQAQLKLADKHNLPLIIHSVKASDIISQQLRKHPYTRGVIHGFSGSLQQAQAFIKLGFFIGIGSRLIHSSPAKAEALTSKLPLKSLLLETDAPDGLGKGERNEPSGLILVANFIAKMRNQDSEAILSVCTRNAQELFQL